MSSRKARMPALFGSALPRLTTMAFVSALASLSIGLSACGSDNTGGFQPLYGPTDGKTYDQRLATVEIANIPGRVGQRIRNELVFNRSTGNEAVSPDWRLDVVISETILTTLVDQTGASSSQIYQLAARYQLINLKTNQKAFDGRSVGRGGFDRFESIYSNIRGRQDAENRVAKSVADEIRTRLLTFLSRSG